MVSMTSRIKRVFQKTFGFWLLQDQMPLIHNITASGTYHLDGYDKKAFNQISMMKIDGIFTSVNTLLYIPYNQAWSHETA